MTPEEIAKGLTPAQRATMLAFPKIRDATPVRFYAAVRFGSLWRKFSKAWETLKGLEKRGLIERRISRGETLWRPTKPLGLEVCDYLRATLSPKED